MGIDSSGSRGRGGHDAGTKKDSSCSPVEAAYLNYRKNIKNLYQRSKRRLRAQKRSKKISRNTPATTAERGKGNISKEENNPETK